MSPGWAFVLSLLLLALNGFFVAAEFALVASKRYRLEQAAAGGSRAARAALDGVRELSPDAGRRAARHHGSARWASARWPSRRSSTWSARCCTRSGCPTSASHLVALLFALALVTFLHLVVGEMAPKSWAITDPERSALLLALPFRAFARVARPVLSVLNGLTNARAAAGRRATSRTSSPRCTARTSCGCCWSSPASTGCSARSSTRC